MNLEQARHNMVVQQIRPWNVANTHLLGLLETLPRDSFVPEDYKHLAYSDTMIPLNDETCMMAPIIEARMMQALNVQPTETVLEIGTGSGFVTALLAKSARHVFSVEIDATLSAKAKENLDAHGIMNLTLEVGDAANGWPEHAPYDVIAITGSLPILPEDLQYCLKPGGRLFAIIGQAPAMEAVLITRTAEHEWTHASLFETKLPPLQNAAEPSRFEF